MSTRTKKIYRITAAYLALNLLAEICWPTAAYALTNGPGQPEFQSFEPAGTTEMVNLFTGDFNYNIPLMTVPGPNGGYPINLAYHAGISMEQEASWTGLGWNINAGAINRAMRGLPDDFNGDQVVKELHHKPATTLNLNLGKNSAPFNVIHTEELLGFAVAGTPSIGLNLYYNNYRGLGFGVNYGITDMWVLPNEAPEFSLPLTLNVSSTTDGIGVNVSYSHYDKQRDATNDFNGWFPKASLSWGSREGLTSLSLGASRQFSAVGSYGGGVTFSKSGFTPVSMPEMTGFISMLGVDIGKNSNFNWKAARGTSLDVSYNRSWVKNELESQSSYGYLYSENSNAISNHMHLEDINREKDVPPSRQTKTLGVPVATYDVYNVSGQGVGGSFRSHRSDIGIYTEPKVTSLIYGGRFDLEFGVPDVSSTTFNWGANMSFSKSETYSGMWLNQWWTIANDDGWNALEDYQFLGASDFPSDHTYEPYYFKMSGEQTSTPTTQLDFLRGTDAVRFSLRELYELPSGTDLAVRPKIDTDKLYTDDIINEAGYDLPNIKNHRVSREKRIVSNQSRTNSQLENFSSSYPANIYTTTNSFPATGGTSTPAAYSYASKPDHHIGEFTEVNPDGNRYVYGIPVYTNSTKDVVFAKEGITEYYAPYLNGFSTTEASTDNVEDGTDQLFSSTKIPEYAETYLLSAIYSPDYVDITGNGPSEDDLGYYVKFNYVKISDNYKWRAPYWDAIVNAGFLSNVNDDKLSYQYGTKEIYHLHSIETKTHVACFFLKDSVRKDGHAAISEDAQGTSTDTQVGAAGGTYALDYISLYSKADPNYGSVNATPLKSVHFTYDYSLCPGVYNNQNNGTDDGKLTLESIYFTYRNNEKGILSPYEFEYIDMNYDSDLRNPGYNVVGNDRWGCYKTPNTDPDYPNQEIPYVDQKVANRERVDQSAAAWSLKKIKLPSGSDIEINYEADDYAYVQDKPAMEMCRVVGTGLTTITTPGLSDITDYITPLHRRIYFELSTPIDHTLGLSTTQKEAIVEKYLPVGSMYFKMFIPLKMQQNGSSMAYDYVEGFCEVSRASGSYGVVNEGSGIDNHYGFLTVELVDRDDYPSTSTTIKANPIQKAAWQYIYLERPDLFSTPNLEDATLTNLGNVAADMVMELPRAIAPYITAFAKGWAQKIDINPTTLACSKRPSYLRLNTPDGVKAGGGHRVKSILINDAWNTLSGSAGATAKYGQEYTYTRLNSNGEVISSGVAAYEPMIGGEEIPLRLPIRYNSDNLVKYDAAFYVTEPMGESYYPAPVVGYSRVVVKSIVGNNNYDETPGTPLLVTKSRTGQTAYEFYTAKDYPVICDRTELQKTWFPVPIFLPFIGSITYNNRGFSQGYSVLLNDMHGKLKAVSTYPYSANLVTANPIPVRRVFYKYNGGYDENRRNQLSSTVTVLTSDGNYGQANLGETYDFFTDMRQHSNETMELGQQFNTNTSTVSGFTLPIVLPLTNISRSLFRSVVAMKVVFRTGILTEVETIDDGSRSVARNLMFDGETGAPLLTTVENEFKRPIYTYNYAGHWVYDGMKGAYHNVGVTFTNMTTTSGVFSVANAENLFHVGDEVMYIANTNPTTASKILWVSAVSGTNVTFIDATGASAGNLTGTFTVMRSGYRNLQSVGNGVIVSLTNPLEGREFPLFGKLNTLSSLAANTVYSFTDCASGNTIYFEMFVSGNTLYFDETTSGGQEIGCRSNIVFPSSYTLTDITQLNGCKFYKAGNTVTVDFPSSADVTATWSDPSHCFNECLDNVLHAAAVRFSDDWTSNVTDKRQAINFDDAGLTVASGFNQYKYAQKGVWRTESNFLYQVDRIQTTASTSGTNISKDGTYDNFVLYDWVTAAENNDRWSHVSRVTRYSPYGYALESRDALGIFSTTIFGYGNTTQTASSSNCQYFELGFDGFEDYPGNSYPEDLDPTGGVINWGHGHLFFNAVSGTLPTISVNYAHTGTRSLAVNAANDAQLLVSGIDGTYIATQQYFEPQPSQEYNFSMWVRATGGGTPAVEIDNGSSITTYTPDNAQSPIEGWKKVDVKFTAPVSTATLKITLKCQTSGTAYFDDIRIQPFKSGMVSYVYDPQTHWLLAELDNRNFATFYNYDEEGSLVQVKQETEKGIFTVKTSRSNIKK